VGPELDAMSSRRARHGKFASTLRPAALLVPVLLVLCVHRLSVALATTENGVGARSEQRPISPQDALIREMLSQHAALSEAFAAVFEIRVDKDFPLGPDRGGYTMTCRYTASQSTEALSVETHYDADPVYQPPGKPWMRDLDFDVDGNMIVSRKLREVSLSTADFNRTSQKEEMLLVSPSGEVVNAGSHVIVFKYPVGERGSMYHFDHFTLVAGRGFRAELEGVKAKRVLADGIHELACTVEYGPGSRGDWFLYVDPQEGNLVRKADMFFPGRDRPSIHMENGGVMREDGLALASGGSVSFRGDEEHSYVLKVSVIDFSAQADLELLDRIRAVVRGPYPPGTDIMDRTAFPSRRYPADQEAGE